MFDENKCTQLAALADNDLFKEEFSTTKSKNDIQDLFSRYGLSLSVEEIDYFVTLLESELQGDELEADALDSVVGGISGIAVIKSVWSATKKIAKPCFDSGVRFWNWVHGYNA